MRNESTITEYRSLVFGDIDMELDTKQEELHLALLNVFQGVKYLTNEKVLAINIGAAGAAVFITPSFLCTVTDVTDTSHFELIPKD